MKSIKLLKKAGKWVGFGLLGLLIIVMIVYGFAWRQTEKRLHKVYDTEYINIEIPDDSASIARGDHLLSVHACKDCHAPDLGGKIMINNFFVGRYTTSNLTRGKGGLPVDYNDQDWLQALKHGVDKQRKPLIGMPSNESTQIPDEDLADIIAYLKSHPPVDNELEKIKIGPLMRILAAFGAVELFPAEQIDHKIAYIEKPKTEVSVEYGATMAINCFGCHKENLQGGPSPLPDHAPAPNISSTGRVGQWTEEQFLQTLKTGITPDGHSLKNEEMPWERFRDYSDVELKAIRVYLLSFPKNKPK